MTYFANEYFTSDDIDSYETAATEPVVVGQSYFTDGVNLYEIAAQRTVTNYGRLGGDITYTILRDVLSGAEANVDALYMMALREVETAQ